MDEMRIGLMPCVRRVWKKIGDRPICVVHIRYEWIYVYKVVFPSVGKSFTYFMPTVNKQCIRKFWEEFVKENEDLNCMIVWDRAGFHQEEDLKDIKKIKFIYLPSHSPELNPVETLWPTYRGFIANRIWNDKNELMDQLFLANDYLDSNAELIKSQTNFNWIKKLHKIE